MALRQRAARRRVAGAGSRRADGNHPARHRGAGNIRCRRLAADRLLRPPAGRRRDLHLDGKLVSLLGGPAAARAWRRPTSSGRPPPSPGHPCAPGQARRFRSISALTGSRGSGQVLRFSGSSSGLAPGSRVLRFSGSPSSRFSGWQSLRFSGSQVLRFSGSQVDELSTSKPKNQEPKNQEPENRYPENQRTREPKN